MRAGAGAPAVPWRAMRLRHFPLAATILLAACGILVTLGVAALLVSTGQSALGIRIIAFVVLVPGVPILLASLVVLLRDPERNRTSRGMSSVLVTVGGLLVLIPLILWLPFWRAVLHIGHLPVYLAIPFIIGMGLLAAGVSAIFLESLVADWRDREYPEVAANLVAIALVVWIASWLVANRLS
jgi:hypothetical protein